MTDRPYPEPAEHGRTVQVGDYELEPGAVLSRESRSPVGASEYTTFVALDVDPDAGTLELYRMTDRERRTVEVSSLASDIDVNTFVVEDGSGDD